MHARALGDARHQLQEASCASSVISEEGPLSPEAGAVPQGRLHLSMKASVPCRKIVLVPCLASQEAAHPLWGSAINKVVTYQSACVLLWKLGSGHELMTYKKRAASEMAGLRRMVEGMRQEMQSLEDELYRAREERLALDMERAALADEADASSAALAAAKRRQADMIAAVDEVIYHPPLMKEANAWR